MYIIVRTFSVAMVLNTMLSGVEIKVEGGEESNDFADVLKSNFFVDKSLLIKDLFNELNLTDMYTSKTLNFVTVLTAPKYGKTTNNNMIKRFLEIPVGDSGNPKSINATSNYKLFKNNNLKVLKDNDFFVKHFGKYPVISINYKSLSDVKSFDHLLEKYRHILLQTFLEHKYLLLNNSLWSETFNKTNFEMFLDTYRNSKLHKYYIFCAFSILAKVLHVHFGKPVFVLIDDFNAVEESPSSKTGEDYKRVVDFIKIVNDDLLTSNKHVLGALLVGALNSNKKSALNVKKKKNYKKEVSSNSKLSKYYGLAQEELKDLLQKLTNDSNTINQAFDEIMSKSIHVKKDKQNVQPCSVWSVIQYFGNQGSHHQVYTTP